MCIRDRAGPAADTGTRAAAGCSRGRPALAATHGDHRRRSRHGARHDRARAGASAPAQPRGPATGAGRGHDRGAVAAVRARQLHAAARFPVRRQQRPAAVSVRRRPQQHPGGEPLRPALRRLTAGAAHDRRCRAPAWTAAQPVRRNGGSAARGHGPPRPRLPHHFHGPGQHRASQIHDPEPRCGVARQLAGGEGAHGRRQPAGRAQALGGNQWRGYLGRRLNLFCNSRFDTSLALLESASETVEFAFRHAYA